MPSSRGGGSFGGGGGHSFGGGHRGGGGGGSRGPRYSTRPFIGARRYYYFDTYGARHFFYYSGVPVKRSIGAIIASTVFFVAFGILFLSLALYSIIPHKLKASKCELYPEYVYDASEIISEDDETYLKNSLEQFYKETGIQPYVYAISYNDVPSVFTPVNKENLHDYAYELYLDTFNDEGHCLILYAVDTDTTDSGLWIEMTGNDAQDVFKDDDFRIFQRDLTTKLRNDYNIKAIGDAFTENIDTVTKLSLDEKVILSVLVCFFALFIGVPIIGFVSSIKQAKQINAYCDYRENNGGQDFVEGNENSNEDTPPTSGADGSDLFD